MTRLNNVKKCELDGVLEISAPTYFEDFRGKYIELYNERIYAESGVNINFIQDDVSISGKGVLRGIHGDSETWKLVSCLYGSFYLVVCNNDPKSKQYMQWVSFSMSGTTNKQILIPPKFGNGHLVLSDIAIFHYKQSTEYNREGQFTIKWDDPKFNFWWPNLNPITSERDKGYQI
jgi:dTDP-4-dehydrorhamnose 3,5-epimerase